MRIVFIILVFGAFTFSCKKSKPKGCEGPESDCSFMECFVHWDYFHFKLIDKTTGEDLVFGPNPRYTVTDIKLFGDAARVYPTPFFRADTANKKFYTMMGRQEMYLEIKGVDVYKLTAEFRFESCCTSIVKNLWQDGIMICSCCSDVIPLAVR